MAYARTTGGTTDTGFLQVTGIPPVLITSPSDKKEVEGKQVTILCEVEANPEPEQSWEKVYRDDVINERDQGLMKSLTTLQNGEKIEFYSWGSALVDGEVNSRITMRPSDGALLIEDSKITDKGVYTCRASNNYGSPVVADAQLDVLKKLEILALPKPAKYSQGGDFTFDCAVEVSPSIFIHCHQSKVLGAKKDLDR